MRLLVLGGTVFLSAEVAAEALRRGHDVTCLVRATSASPPAGARLIRADRSHGAEAYAEASGEWDAVIDVSTHPARVRLALAALAERARHWSYISSCSAYVDQDHPGDDESAATATPLPDDLEYAPAVYASAKVACENACRETLADRLHVSRPGLIGGLGDASDRFGYWPARFARNPDLPVLVPECAGIATQTIDVRDLATWLVVAAENGVVGTLNAMGVTTPLADVLQAARTAAGHTGATVVVDATWLLAHDVQPWSGPESLPLWIPTGMQHDGFSRRECTAAVKAGLHQRPVRETIEAALENERRLGIERERTAGLSPEREAILLQEWALAEG